jgi:hypothetical protein
MSVGHTGYLFADKRRIVRTGWAAWTYWVQRRENGRGESTYAVYREIPMSWPAELVETFPTEAQAWDFIQEMPSDV